MNQQFSCMRIKPDGPEHFRIIFLQCLTDGQVADGISAAHLPDLNVCRQPIYSISVLVIAFKAQFIPNPQRYEDGARHAHRQPGKVDERVGFMAPDVAYGDY